MKTLTPSQADIYRVAKHFVERLADGSMQRLTRQREAERRAARIDAETERFLSELRAIGGF